MNRDSPLTQDAGAAWAPDELVRYRRHLSLPEIGLDGQQRLKSAAVLCVGAGGLGSPAALYLAAAGVGRLGLVDFDRVDASNLQRQVLHGTKDIGRRKVDSARERLEDLNPLIRVETYDAELNRSHATRLLGAYDLVIDGSDNFRTRYLVSDACMQLDKPFVYGGIFRFEGQASLFHASQGPCYRCLFPSPPAAGTAPGCAEIGVVGALPGLIGSIQALEAIKWILGVGKTLLGRLLMVDALTMQFRELQLVKDPDCPVCGSHPRGLDADHEGEPNPPALDPEASAASQFPVPEISSQRLKARLDEGDRPILLDVREPFEYALCRLPGAVLIPISDLEARMGELDAGEEIVVYCHVGIRSAAAAAMLRKRGFAHVHNLTGGIQAWAETVDPMMPTY